MAKFAKDEGGTWTGRCERPGCGGFTSTGHRTKRAAQERLSAHDTEHDEGIEAAHRQLLEEES